MGRVGVENPQLVTKSENLRLQGSRILQGIRAKRATSSEFMWKPQ